MKKNRKEGGREGGMEGKRQGGRGGREGGREGVEGECMGTPSTFMSHSRVCLLLYTCMQTISKPTHITHTFTASGNSISLV